MIRYATLEQARMVVPSWNGEASSVRHLGNSASSVFVYRQGQVSRILKLTDASFRTANEVAGELAYLDYLKNMDIRVSFPLVTEDGQAFLVKAWGNGEFICTSWSFAEGDYVDESSPYWNEAFFREWGRSIAAIHVASRRYVPSDKRLWEWDEEVLFAKAEGLLPKNDFIIRNELSELVRYLACLPKTNHNYGIIHADHAPQNFAYHPASGGITIFDFGNSCYHWFVADLANTFSTLRLKKDRDMIKNSILEGYCETETLPRYYEEQLAVFLRLRAVYVYLDRLYSFGPTPNAEQHKTLEKLKARVHSMAGKP